jgi:hypothetical protein
MQVVDSPAMEFATRRGGNEFRLNRLHQDSQLASRKYTLLRKVGVDGTGTKSLRNKEGACCFASASIRPPELRYSKRSSFGLISFSMQVCETSFRRV